MLGEWMEIVGMESMMVESVEVNNRIGPIRMRKSCCRLAGPVQNVNPPPRPSSTLHYQYFGRLKSTRRSERLFKSTLE